MLIGDLFVMSANISNNVTGGFIMGLPPFHMDTFFIIIITKTIKKENYFWCARTSQKTFVGFSKEALNKGDTQHINLNKQNN